jgi:heptosyltransferase-2
MNKILVIQTAFIGDVILATSVLESLHASYPQAQIDFLVRKGNEPLLKGHPFVGQLYVWNKKEGKWRSLFNLLSQIRNANYDAVFNLQRFASSGILTAFSKAPIKAGFKKNPLSFLFNFKTEHSLGLKGDQQYLHEVDRNLEVIKPWLRKAVRRPHLYPTPQDEERVSLLTGCPFITISPASVWETKKTPVSKWLELMKASSVKVYLLGGPSDREFCEELRAMTNNDLVVNIAGDLTLLQSAALMRQAQMNFVNDSGPLHLCSATNAPVTAVFCSTIPEFGFGPLSDRSIVIQERTDLTCRPCGLHGHKVCPKGHFNCGNLISTVELIDQLK